MPKPGEKLRKLLILLATLGAVFIPPTQHLAVHGVNWARSSDI
jgi:hypothetical protein